MYICVRLILWNHVIWFIEETMQLVLESANKKGITISYEIAKDLTVKADEYMFKAGYSPLYLRPLKQILKQAENIGCGVFHAHGNLLNFFQC